MKLNKHAIRRFANDKRIQFDIPIYKLALVLIGQDTWKVIMIGSLNSCRFGGYSISTIS